MLKKIFSHTLACICLLMSMQGMAKPGKPAMPSAARLISQQQASPLLFTENRGQVTDKAGKARPDILFTAQNGNTSLFLKAAGLYYQFTKVSYPAGYDPSNTGFTNGAKQAELEKQVVTQTYNFSLTLEGANPHPNILRQDKSITGQNFYLPQCPDGITHVAGYQKLVYEEVYPHIDWIVYSNGSHLKYDFLVKPGGDPSLIKLRIKDAEGVSITKDGGLLMKTSLGEVREKAPVSYAGGQQVTSSFRQNDDGTIGFEVAAQPGKVLRIDPTVVWNTYFGGTGTEYNSGCAVDGSGNVYISGYTASSTAIASGGLQTTIGGGQDAYLAKFNPSGYLLWSTYYGGTGTDQGIACALDPAGNVYLSGATNSATGIASGGFQNTIAGGIDLFLVKFDASGSRLWGTYYGGTGGESATAASICTDASGNVYMAGSTPSTTGIASGGFQNTIGGGSDAFLVKFNAAGSRLWATYYGGSLSDASQGCTTDASGNVYMTGNTSSTTGIAAGGFQNAFSGGTNAYLVKFDAAGNRLWGTYYGGTSAGDVGYACITDASDNVYMAGSTTSTTGIASGGFQNTFGGGTGTDGFLVKFNAAGNRLWGSYYGGNSSDGILGCALDAAGNIYLTGTTGSTTGIASGGFQNTLSTPNDAFVAEVSPSGSLLWGSYYGSTGNEQARSCAIDASGNVFVTGFTLSATGLVIPGTFQSTIGGGQDAFLLKIGTPGLFTDTAIATTPMCAGSALNVPFTLFGTYNAGNVFTAQLSNAAGSFTSPVNIGTIIGTAAGTISATIPAGTPAGTGYRIRIISSNPVMIAPNNGKNLAVTVCCVRTTSTITQTICSNALPYTWRGDVITAGGLAVADDTLVNAGGCDSVITLNLTVNTTTTSIESKSYCINQLPQTWHGTTIPVGTTSNAAYATYTTTNAAGCDSIVTLNLTVSTPTATTVQETICSSQLPYNWRGHIITAGGNAVAIDTQRTNGCDNTVTLNLTVNAGIATPTWVTYTKANTANGLIANDVRSVIIDAANNKWFGTTGGGSMFNGTAWTTYTTPNLGYNFVMTTMIDAAGNKWFGTPSGADKFDGTTWTHYTSANTGGALGQQVGGIAQDPSGDIWFCSRLAPVGIAKFNGTTWTRYLPTTTVISVAIDAAGVKWFATSGGGVIRYDGTTFTTYTTANGLAGNNVASVAIDPAGNKWFGTTAGVSKFDGTAWTNYTTANGLANNLVYAIAFDAAGNKWFGTIGGVSKFDGTTWTTYTTANGLASNIVYAIAIDAAGKKWIGTESGVSVFSTECLPPPCTRTASTITDTICSNLLPYTWRGDVITAGGMAVADDTLVNAAGCDSIITLNLIVKQRTTSIEAKSYCANQLPQIWHGTTIPAGAISNAAYATYTITNSVGCDSIITLNLTIKQSTAGTESKTYCAGQLPQTWHGTNIPVGAASNVAYATFAMPNAAGCDSIITLNLTITPAVVPAVTISAVPGNTICTGTAVTFTAATVNGGSTPVYQWRRNGITVGTTNTYTSNSLNDQDTILCIMGSSAGCVTNPIDTSNVIVMTVNATVPPTVIITANPGTSVSSGTLVTFTAIILNGGTTPLYQWKKNNTVVSTNTTYATSTLANSDVITCVVTGNNPCATANVDTSNALVINISTGIGHTGNAVHDLKLYPNPNNGSFTVEASAVSGNDAVIEVINAVGQLVYQQKTAVLNNRLNTQVNLPEQVTARGVYLLRIRTDEGIDVLRFLLTR